MEDFYKKPLFWIIVGVIILLWWFSRQPHIRFNNIDWEGKSVDYIMTAKGEKIVGQATPAGGKVSGNDSVILFDKKLQKGDILFEIYPDEKTEEIVFKISENGKLLKQEAVNFKDKVILIKNLNK